MYGASFRISEEPGNPRMRTVTLFPSLQPEGKPLFEQSYEGTAHRVLRFPQIGTFFVRDAARPWDAQLFQPVRMTTDILFRDETGRLAARIPAGTRGTNQGVLHHSIESLLDFKVLPVAHPLQSRSTVYRAYSLHKIEGLEKNDRRRDLLLELMYLRWLRPSI